MTLLRFHFVHVRSDTLFTIGYFCDPIFENLFYFTLTDSIAKY